MTITRSYQWYRTNSNDPTASPAAITGATQGMYTTVNADVGKYLHLRETATNAKGSATSMSQVIGPIQAAGEVYSPAAGFIAPVMNTYFGQRPLVDRIVKRSELEVLDGEIDSMNVLHGLMHDATPAMTAVQSGRWTDPATWGNTSASANGGFPSTDGMTAHVGTAFDVLFDMESDAKLKYIVVHGRLRWDIAKDTRLYVDTIHTGAGSYFEIGTKLNPVPESTTPGKPRADIIFVGEKPGSSTRLGLMTMGKVSIHGAAKTEKVDIDNAVAGATTIQVKAGQSLVNWRQGDHILVLSRDYTGFGTDPQYKGPNYYYEREANINNQYFGDANGFKRSHDEHRTLTAAPTNGLLTINQALQWAHVTRTTSGNLPTAPVTPVPGFTGGQKVSIPARIVNMSRSVRFSSGAANLADNQNRAHIMMMASDQVDCRWAEAKNMARTDTDPTLWISEPKYNPAYPALFHHTTVFTDQSLTVDLGNPLNVRGRYAWHLHGGAFGNAARLNRNMCIWEGLTAWAPQVEVPQPGWAMTHHNSRLSISKCVVYNVRGAGIVSEIGSEIGQWFDNTVCWARGDGWGPFWGGRQREQPNHNGHSGVAYENQSRAVLQHNNEFTSCRIGWLYSVQTQLTTNGYGVPKGQDHQSLRHFNPIVGPNGGYDFPDRDSYGKAEAQIPDLNFCVGVDCAEFFRVDHRVEVLRGDPTAMIAVGWRAYGCDQIQHFDNYTYKYFFRDFAYFGGNGGAVAFLGTRTAIFGWKNGIVEGYSKLADSGGQANYGPGWIDIATTAQEGDANPQGIRSSAGWPNTTPSMTPNSGVNDYKFDLQPGVSKIKFTGTMVDGYSPGGRFWPEFREPGPAPQNPDPGYAVNYVEGYQMEALVDRNGCYKVGNNWFMPAWYTTVNWRDFTHFVFKIDHPMTGNWDPAFLARNTVVPVAPEYPLKLEDINKPWPIIAPPTNISPPFISGRRIAGTRVICNWGKWSEKPNDCDWPSFTWRRNGTAVGSSRYYDLTAADVGATITCDVAMYNTGGKSAVVSTAGIQVKAAYTGRTPQQIFGANLMDFWTADDPDTSTDIYNKNIKSPGLAMGSFRLVEAWGGAKRMTQLQNSGSRPNVQETRWGAYDGRMVSYAPLMGDHTTPIARQWTDFGTGTNPIHLWATIQRDPNSQNQQQVNAPMIRCQGHETMISTEAGQNLLLNNAGGSIRTVSTAFGKGVRGVVYHARNSQGSHCGFNNVRSVVNNGGPITDRQVDIGYNGAYFGVNTLWWVQQDIISDQDHADMQAYLAYMDL